MRRFSLLSGLLNTEVFYMTARFQLLHQPARLVATTGPCLIARNGVDRTCCSLVSVAIDPNGDIPVAARSYTARDFWIKF